MCGVRSCGRLVVLVPLSVAVSQCGDSQLPVNPMPTGELVGLTVGPANRQVQEGDTLQLQASRVLSGGTLEDATRDVTWMSSNEAIATVDGRGLVTAVEVGTASIGVALGSLRDATFVFVTPRLIELQSTPFAPRIAIGVKQQFVTTGVFSDYSLQNLSDQTTWAFPDSGNAVAVVDPNGVAEGVQAGTTTLAASFGGLFVTTAVDVVDEDPAEILVTPATLVFASAISRAQLKATAVFGDFQQDVTSQVNWTSSDAGVAAVSSDGSVRAGAEGQARITASFMGATGETAVTVGAVEDLEVVPASLLVPVGWTGQLQAFGVLQSGARADLTAQVIWSIVKDRVEQERAAVDDKGLVIGTSSGSAEVRAEIKLSDVCCKKDAKVEVIVAPLTAVSLSPMDPTVVVGANQPFALQGIFTRSSTQTLTSTLTSGATWRSLNRSVAGISNHGSTHGEATALRTGTTAIEVRFVRDGEIFEDATVLTVRP